uniref:Transcription factor hy5 n=1 Tax=Solanum tuberosum TaxID=4113 RepID=M1DRD9_SOLTU
MAEHATLKTQLGVPLVTIPKLKSQALAPAPKSSKNVEKKKSEVKTKKVASVSFLGVFFFILLFSGLDPLLKVRYGGVREPFMSGESFVSGFNEKHHGRVLTIDGHVSGTGYFGKYGGKDDSLHCGHGGQGESNQQNSNKVVDEFVHVGNGSDPLAASLYVPRNDKLVEIDGSLIIKSVLASEKAIASYGSADKKNREPGLTVPRDLSPSIPGIHPRLYRSTAVGERVLGSEEKKNVKATMEQWYLEGVVENLRIVFEFRRIGAGKRKRKKSDKEQFRQWEIYTRVFGERTQEEKRGERATFVVPEGLACGFRQGLIPKEVSESKENLRIVVEFRRIGAGKRKRKGSDKELVAGPRRRPVPQI